MTEQWKPVLGFADLYEVSDLGRVRSLARIDRRGVYRPSVLLRPGPSGRRRNYRIVNLYRDGSAVVRAVHRLVLEAFVGPPPPGTEACHTNGCGSDNRLANLRWDTRESNAHDRIWHGTSANQNRVKTHCIRGHEFSGSNLHIRRDGRRTCRTCARERAAQARRTAR